MVIPFTKYFCTNGYSNRIGPVVTTDIAIRNVSPGISAMVMPVFWAASLMAWILLLERIQLRFIYVQLGA